MLGDHDLKHEVHLWFLPTESLSESELARQAETVLSPDEQHRAGRFAFEKDRRSYIAAHWLLRWALSQYHPIPPADWKFTRSLQGKPAVEAPAIGQALQINLSHTLGMVACAVTRVGEVGVDVESVKTREHLRIARRFFAPSEVEQLEQLPLEQHDNAFFRLWTLKEAYIKARGLGLAIDLASFAFPNVMGESIEITFAQGVKDQPADWEFFRHEPGEHHKIAAAVHHRERTKIAWKVFDDILERTAENR